MITFLSGKLIEAIPTHVVVDVNGVGYEALIPLSSFDKLPPPGQPVKLLTQLIVREDAHILYGFMTSAERDLFRLLIHSVSGIGPKTALNILSGMNVAAFRGAVASSDVKSLSQISGVGKKTAERIVVELRDKIGAEGIERGYRNCNQSIFAGCCCKFYDPWPKNEAALEISSHEPMMFEGHGKPVSRWSGQTSCGN